VSETLHSILVANRGEIVQRVFRTARSMGLRCIAVYSDADRDAPFVTDADIAVRLPGGYLDSDAILAAAQRMGANAIHPGYGFLSENASFARAVINTGICWVGPAPDVIETMGDKLAAKQAAERAGVPTLPSSDDPGHAATVGYPLLVKAAAGGGGKGMRVVHRAEDLAEAVASAQREAANAFGDDRVFLERYVAASRHVEIQILGDQHGNLVHLGERECSIQRRHQKIIEESPSPIVDHGLRAAMGDAALALASSMAYSSLGTVEFLVDDASREFFFLEVNTRLQVEHPVTEEVTGRDLVREQLRVAAGEPLDFGTDDVTWDGHAIEVRLYAEDPSNGFLPASGTLAAFAPSTEPVVRWESGVRQGSVVGVEYDPMLAKVIAHAPTRTEAAQRLALALERLHLAGVTTNRDFLVATLRSEAFLAGDTTTDFIERVPVVHPQPFEQVETAAVVAAMWLQGRNRQQDGIWGFAPSNFRVGGFPPQWVEFATPAAGENGLRIEYQPRRSGGFVLANGRVVTVHRWSDTDLDLDIDGVRRVASVSAAGGHIHVSLDSTTVSLAVTPRFAPPGSDTPTGGLVAPMPGIVLELRCAEGDQVAAGQVLVVLEAMKMEHHIAAPIAGVVSSLLIAEGQQLENGALLLTIEPPPMGGGDG